MPAHPPLPIPLPLFHIPRRRLLPNLTAHRAQRPISQSPRRPAETDDTTSAPDDFYALLLSSPLASQPTPQSAPRNRPATAPEPPPQKPTISFSTPLAGPSPHMRGLARAASGEGRPPEPDNCCMSGCVNCVWEQYREEVETWAAERKRVRGVRGMHDVKYVGPGTEDGCEVGELDGMDGGGEEGLFEGVDVGMREFMRTEKRVRERRERRERERGVVG